MIKAIKRALVRLARKRQEAKANRKRQRQRRREKKHGRDEARENRDAAAQKLDRALAEHPRDLKLIADLRAEVAEYDHKVKRRARAFEHARHRARKLSSWLRWSIKRQTYLRKKLKKAQAANDLTPQPFHGNGHEWHLLTDRAKKLLAIAVVKYGCFCTSIFRGWGTGSWHDVIPTRGFDCGGARMEAFQEDLRFGRIDGFDLSDLLELIGPDNNAWAKNGQPWSGAEGSALEQQHDNHTHAFVFGS